MDKLKNLIIKYKNVLLLIPALIVYCLIMHFTGIHCPIKFLTGVSCGGCGMTRAYVALLKGDFAGAFNAHPLFILPPVVVVVLMNKSKLTEKVYKIFIFTVISVFVIVYLYRLILGSGDIVVFEPQNGLIFKTLVFLRKCLG